MRFVWFVFVLILHGCKTISESPVLLETTQNMGAMSSLQLPDDWQPIKDKYTWDELQFTYPGTHRLTQEFAEDQCVAAFHEPDEEQIKYGMLGEQQFHHCIGMIIAESGSDKQKQKVFIDALLNWSSKPEDPWRKIPKKPYSDSMPYWYESTSNVSVITSWYALNRNYWGLSELEKKQIDRYLISYFQWADFDTPAQSGRMPCSIGNPAGTARENVDTDTCGSVRMKGATATLALALATGDRPTYQKALTHLAVIFHQFDEDGFFVPYMGAKKLGAAFSYYYESARFVSSWIELYKTVDVDILDFRLPSGVTISGVLNTAYNVSKNHLLLGKYPVTSKTNYNNVVGLDWDTVKNLDQEEFEANGLYNGAWNFAENDLHFALHNPRFAIEHLGIEAPWEVGYDGYERQDFHSFQPAHLYLANREPAPAIEKDLSDFDGVYEVQWSVWNSRDQSNWRNVSLDYMELEGGVGRLQAIKRAPGSAEQRQAFFVSIDGRGNLRIKGFSGLLDDLEARKIWLYGSITNRVLETYWGCCNRIRATVRWKAKSPEQLEEERRQAFEKKVSENRTRLVASAEKLKSAAAEANKAAQSGLDDLLALAKYSKSDGRWSVDSTPLTFVEFQPPQIYNDLCCDDVAKAKINGRVVALEGSSSKLIAAVDSLPFLKRLSAITRLTEGDEDTYVSFLASELRPNFVVIAQLRSAISECGTIRGSKDLIVIPVITDNEKNIQIINCYRKNFAAASEGAGNFIDGMILAAPGIADYMQTLKALE